MGGGGLFHSLALSSILFQSNWNSSLFQFNEKYSTFSCNNALIGSALSPGLFLLQKWKGVREKSWVRVYDWLLSSAVIISYNSLPLRWIINYSIAWCPIMVHFSQLQEPIIRSEQLPRARFTAFSRTSLFLERFWREFWISFKFNKPGRKTYRPKNDIFSF